MNDYDVIPYRVATYPQTHPAHLAALGRLIGLETPDPRAARILELGCASGGNLIPIGWYNPHARCLGVELSGVQAEAGMKRIDALGLDNVRIIQADVSELGEEVGEFDFIIAHGLWSWVPDSVRTRVLALCQRQLAPHGIAFLSFNTLPGWHRRGTLREQALYGARGTTKPVERLERARKFLGDLSQDLGGAGLEPFRWIKDDITRVLSRDPSYFYHDYLEIVNDPMLFSDFMTKAATHDLQYLGDADVRWTQSSLLALLPPTATARLKQMSHIIEQEQYVDFLCNREFRGTLLCRSALRITHEFDLSRLRSLALHSNLKPVEPPVLDRACNQIYSDGGNQKFVVVQPVTRAALGYLADKWPDSVAFEDLLDAARRRLPGGVDAKVETFLPELATLFLHGLVYLDVVPQAWRTVPEARPVANKLVRIQAAAGEPLIGPRHNSLTIDSDLARLTVMLDGTRSTRDIAEIAAAETRQPGTASSGAPSGMLTPAQMQTLSTQNTVRLVERLTEMGMLENTPRP